MPVRETRLGGALGAPDALELWCGLHASPRVEERLVDGQLDPLPADAVEVPGRERVWHGGAAASPA